MSRLKKRLGDEFVGLIYLGASSLIVIGAFVEDRGIVHLAAGWLRMLLGGAVWYVAFSLGYAGICRFRGRKMYSGTGGLFAWFMLTPVIAGLLQALGRWSSVREPGGRVGWLVFHYLATLTSLLSSTIILMLSLFLLLMLALDLPLSEMFEAPGRAVLAVVSFVLFIAWIPFFCLHRCVFTALRVLHRCVYWLIEDLSTIGEYLVSKTFARRRSAVSLPIAAPAVTGGARQSHDLAAGQPPSLSKEAVERPFPARDASDETQPDQSAPAAVDGTGHRAGSAVTGAGDDGTGNARNGTDVSDGSVADDGMAPVEEGKSASGTGAAHTDGERPSPDGADSIEPEDGKATGERASQVHSGEGDDEGGRKERPGADPDSRESEDPLERIERRARKARKGDQLKLFTGAGQNRKSAARWRKPSIELFSKPPGGRRGEDDALLRQRADKLIETLGQFKIEAKVLEIVAGPTITQFQIKPASGIKLSKITALSNDIAMALACRSVRIEAPIPGKSAVGIEVPNENPEAVLFSEIVSSSDYKEARDKSILSFALGKSISGKPIIADLRKMPHLLVAGATGSGKSVCINTILASILYQARPDQVRMLMIDPKMVELVSYNEIPHLVSDVVTNPQDAGTALRWAVLEMERRYRFLSQFGVRNIESYNQQLAAGELFYENGDPVEDGRAMPYMVIIIDELADLMMVAAKEIESAICRLAQMARAVGMHLIIATQRPSTNIITGVIKANFPSRIAFAVSSKVDSKVILDTIGADALLGRGDMLYLPVGQAKPLRVQGAFISEEEVRRLTGFLKKQGKPEYVDIHADLVEAAAPAEPSDKAMADDMWEPALKLAVELGEVSTSLLQRHLNIGYNRAARIVDAMFERGIISGRESGRRRKVLIAEEQLSEFLG